MSKRKTKAKFETFEVGNQVRVRTSGGGRGDTLYEITALMPGCGCMIREVGMVDGKHYASQLFDTSLLTHAVTDEMLAAFSFGPLKAGR